MFWTISYAVLHIILQKSRLRSQSLKSFIWLYRQVLIMSYDFMCTSGQSGIMQNNLAKYTLYDTATRYFLKHICQRKNRLIFSNKSKNGIAFQNSNNRVKLRLCVLRVFVLFCVLVFVQAIVALCP